MKQRIIAAILLLVTVLTMFAGCANYAFAERDDFDSKVFVDLPLLMEKLQNIEIEDEDFGPEGRDEIVKREIYNSILSTLNNDSQNKITDGKIGAYDMVEYFYYCDVEIGGVTYIFNYNMKTATTSLVSTSSSKDEKTAKENIVNGLAKAEWVIADKQLHEVTTSLTNERIPADKPIVVSYSLKVETLDADGKVERTTYTDYANVEITSGELYTILRDNYAGIGSFTPSSDHKDILVKEDKNADDKVTERRTYSGVTVSHIVEAKGDEFTYEHTMAAESSVTAYESTDGRKVSLVLEEGQKVNYHVYPVSHIVAPTIDAESIVKYVLNDDITADSLPVFKQAYSYNNETVESLVNALKDEYAKNLSDYAVDQQLHTNLDTERKLAKRESIYDAVEALKNAKNSDGKTAAEVLVDAYNSKNDNDVADIHALFDKLAEGDNTVTWPEIRKFLVAPWLELLGFKSGSKSATALIDEVIAVYAKSLEAFDSYVNSNPDIYELDANGNVVKNENDKPVKVAKIDVVDKKEQLEEAETQAQLVKVNELIGKILACTNENGESIQGVIYREYIAKLQEDNGTTVYENISSYDVLRNILLSTSATSTTFSFIEELSSYVYGKSTLKDEDRDTFDSILADLVKEFSKSATSDYESVGAVKTAKNEYNTENETLKTLSGEVTAFSPDLTVASYDNAFKAVYTYLNSFKKGDVTAFEALVNAYTDYNKDSVFVMKSEGRKDKQVLVDTDSERTSVLKEILASDLDVMSVLTAEYTKTVKENDEDVVKTLDNTIWTKLVAAYNQNKVVAEKNEAYAKAQNEAKEAAVDVYVKQLLSGIKTEGDKVSVLSVELTGRYFNSLMNSKISTYNSNVQNKLTKALYEIINNKEVVVLLPGYETLVEDLLDEFVKTLKENYEYEYYTGTSDKYSTGTPAEYDEEQLKSWKEQYEAATKKLTQANSALTSANAGISKSTDYTNVIVVIADVLGGYADLSVEAQNYYNAKKAYETAKANLDFANDEIDIWEDKIASLEKDIEIVKNQKLDKNNTIFDRINALIKLNGQIDTYEKYIKENQKEIDKKKTGLSAVAEAAQTELNNRSKALLDSLTGTKNVDNSDITAANFPALKEAYTTAATAYNNIKARYEKLTSLETAVKNAQTAYDAVKDGEDTEAIAKNKEALEKAEKALADYISTNSLGETKDTAEENKADYTEKAKAYKVAVERYYAASLLVKASAETAIEEANNAINDQTDSKGKVTKKGLATLIKEAETDVAGEQLSNIEAFGSFDAFLEYKLGSNPEEALKKTAMTMIDEQIRVYAVAKALVKWVNPATQEVVNVVANGYTNGDIDVNGYAEELNANKTTFVELFKHSLGHDHENWKDKKLTKKAEKEFEKLIEATEEVFVTKKVYNDYKKELGRSQYVYYKNQSGDNNLRMSLQFSNLITYLLFANYEVNPYATHEDEYMLKIAEDGKYLEYFFISYHFASEANTENAGE